MDQPTPTPDQTDESERKPHVIAAPGMLDHKHTVIREADETDAEYEARCLLFAAMLNHAEQ